MRNGLFVLMMSFCLSSAVWAQARPISADFDGNGAVDFRDFSKLMSHLGQVELDLGFDPAVDLNNDDKIDGEDAFVFADVFSDDASEALWSIRDGENAQAKLRLDPDGNGYLIYLEDIVSIGGYRIVFSLPAGVSVSKVHDLIGIGLLPVRRTSDGVEIVGLTLGNRPIEHIEHSGLIAKVTFQGDLTGIDIEAVHLRGIRAKLLNHEYIGERNEIASNNISMVALGDVEVSRRIFDFGHLALGKAVSDTFSIKNTFDTQQVPPGTTRKLSFELTTSGPEIAVLPKSVGVLTDSTQGLSASRMHTIKLTVTPRQPGVFSGYVNVKTNRQERENIRIHVMARVREGDATLTRVIADFDTNGTVDYGDFDQLITRFGQTLRLSKYDLDRDGVVDADDAFLFADVLGGGVGLAYLDRVDVIAGVNGHAAVRVQGAGEELNIFARELKRLGGYRIVLKYNSNDVALRWARDRTGGGILPIHKTSTGAEIVGMGFGALVNTPDYLDLVEINVRPLKGQSNVQSLISIGDVILRGSRGERDSIKAERIGADGLDAIPRVIDFGTLRQGMTVTDTVHVFDMNAEKVGFMAVSSDSTVLTNRPRAVGPFDLRGRGWPVRVTYTATELGPFSGTLTITSATDDPTPIVVQIRASVTGIVQAMPDSLTFGEVLLGQSDSLSVRVTNPNAAALRISAIDFARSDSNFVTDVALPLTVAGRDSTAIAVRFNPRLRGVIRDTLRIATEDTTFSIPLSGRGAQSLPRVDYDELDFGTVGQGKDSLQTVTVSNDGNIAQIISNVMVTGDGFALASAVELPDSALPDTLNAGDTRAIRVRFAPDMAGDYQGTLRIVLAAETLEIGLSGTGRVSNPDFDGDGEVDFDDFILFARAFGTSSNDEQFDPRYDLDGDGEVGFADFIAFAEKFGQRVG